PATIELPLCYESLNYAMNISRREALRAVTFAGLALAACTSRFSTAAPDSPEAAQIRAKLNAIPMNEKVNLSNDEWRKILPPDQYRVLRESGTEPAFHNEYWNNHEPGTFVCAACGNPLFSSETKFESGTGWPSFYAPIKKEG